MPLTSNASFPVIQNFVRTILLSLKRLSVQVMQRRYPRLLCIDRMVRCGLFHTMVSTIIRSCIKFAWFSTVPPVTWDVPKQRAVPGTNLTNSLLGVLIRLHQEPIAIMGNVQSMFHQVRVPEEDRDLLRFHWWPKGDFTKKLDKYRMTVHLFGAVSSPSCANFAMWRNMEDHKQEFSPNVANTILTNFYVDDC